MIEIELGENNTALVQGATRAVLFSPRSISTKYSSAKSQKPLGCASRFLRLPRGILLKTLSRVLSPYTSRFKNYIVRFHIKFILTKLWRWPRCGAALGGHLYVLWAKAFCQAAKATSLRGFWSWRWPRSWFGVGPVLVWFWSWCGRGCVYVFLLFCHS